MVKKFYKIQKEKIKIKLSKSKKEGVMDYISGNLVRSGIKEHEEAVNIFSQRLVEELDYSKDQIQTMPQFRVKVSPSGQEKYPVDIVVFNDKKKSYDNVYMIIECKQLNRKDGRRQLDIYLNLVPSVEIGVWFNGKGHLYLWKVRDKKTQRWIWIEIPDLPKKSQRVEDIGLYKRKDLEAPKNLKAVFNDIHNHLAGNTTGIARDEAFASEIINLLFCKIYDEINTPPDQQINFRAGVNESKEEIKERIVNLFEKVKREYDDVFEEEDRIKLDEDSILYVVGELQKYAITKAERDAIGDAFEVFIGPALRGGEGQFFTPRNVVKMVVKMLDPEIDDYIIDPACGSGGFLIVALEFIWSKLEKEANKKGWTKEFLAVKKRELASRYITGIDKDSFLAKVTKAYMAIIGDGRGGIFCENSLLPPSDWNQKTRQKISLESFDLLVTNPPFGAKIPVRGDKTLEQYDLGFKWKCSKETKVWERTNKLQDHQPPQILFIERCLQLLKPGGKMGIVLPEGILGNMNDEYIRKLILDKSNILAIVDLPSETFKLPGSKGTGTKTCLLFLQKKDNHTKENNKIFLAIAKNVGHNRRGKPIDRDDTLNIIDSFRNKTNTELSFWIKGAQIKDLSNFIPRRYDFVLDKPLRNIKKNGIQTILLRKLMQENIIQIQKGDEVGSENYTTEGISFIRTNDIVNGIINRNSKQMVDEDLYNEIYKEKQDLRSGDILFTKDGKIGIVGMIKEGDECIIASGILKIRVLDFKRLNPFYLFAALNSKIVFNQAQARYVTAATIMHLHLERFLDIEIPFLPIGKQDKVGERIKYVFDLKSEADNLLDELRERFLL